LGWNRAKERRSQAGARRELGNGKIERTCCQERKVFKNPCPLFGPFRDSGDRAASARGWPSNDLPERAIEQPSQVLKQLNLSVFERAKFFVKYYEQTSYEKMLKQTTPRLERFSYLADCTAQAASTR
jgi:hypothetical protein